MSGEEVRRVSRQDIQLVQNLIEGCLQLYMNRKEVVDTLLVKAKIEPGFTELVWQKLEEENQEFFKAYHVRLMVKNQINLFNKLLDKQVDLMRQMSSGVAPVSITNGSQTSSYHQIPPSHNTAIRPNNVHHPTGLSRVHNTGTLTRGSMHVDDTLRYNERVDVLTNLPQTQNPPLGVKQEINGGDMLERAYSNHAAFTTFDNVESNSDTMNEKLPDTENTSFGFLGQIPRNFSLSDLTSDFSHSFDILENYPRSPFVPPVHDNLLDLTGRDYEGENKRLNGTSEDFNYDDFSSD